MRLNIDVNQRRDLLCLAIFYLVAHLPLLLLSNAIYWDDWFLYAGNQDFIIRIFREQAATLFFLEGPLHLFFLQYLCILQELYKFLFTLPSISIL